MVPKTVHTSWAATVSVVDAENVGEDFKIVDGKPPTAASPPKN